MMRAPFCDEIRSATLFRIIYHFYIRYCIMGAMSQLMWPSPLNCSQQLKIIILDERRRRGELKNSMNESLHRCKVTMSDFLPSLFSQRFFT